MRPRRCHPYCGCQKPKQPIVHPVKEDVVHCCTEETVKHVHPSHTTVKNHHVIKNEHVYPHSTSMENSCECVDVNKCEKCMPGKQMAGGKHYGKGMHPGMYPGMKPHPYYHKWR